jgi:hypothetical protein
MHDLPDPAWSPKHSVGSTTLPASTPGRLIVKATNGEAPFNNENGVTLMTIVKSEYQAMPDTADKGFPDGSPGMPEDRLREVQ